MDPALESLPLTSLLCSSSEKLRVQRAHWSLPVDLKSLCSFLALLLTRGGFLAAHMWLSFCLQEQGLATSPELPGWCPLVPSPLAMIPPSLTSTGYNWCIFSNSFDMIWASVTAEINPFLPSQGTSGLLPHFFSVHPASAYPVVLGHPQPGHH